MLRLILSLAYEYCCGEFSVVVVGLFVVIGLWSTVDIFVTKKNWALAQNVLVIH